MVAKILDQLLQEENLKCCRRLVTNPRSKSRFVKVYSLSKLLREIRIRKENELVILDRKLFSGFSRNLRSSAPLRNLFSTTHPTTHSYPSPSPSILL